MKSALTWDEHLAELAAAVRRESAEKCMAILESESVLDDFVADLDKAGVVGEARAAKVLYLVVTTRVQSRIVSLTFKASSSTGKSYLMQKVLEFFPEQSYFALSLMSEKLLARFTEPMKHRFLVIYEAAGISKSKDSQQQYMVRSLLSEGRIKYGVNVKGEDGDIHAVVLELEGPTGFLTTTTSVFLEPELETRILSVPLTETREQTEAIMRRTAEQRPDTSDKEKWRAFQTWIQSGPTDVNVPYAEDLAKRIPGVTQRLRRDFSVIIELVKAHALLHQAGRRKDKQGRVVATPADYAAVHALMNDLIAESVGVQIPERARAVVAAIEELMADHSGKNPGVAAGSFPGATNVEIAKKLKTSRAGIKMWVDQAALGGWITNISEKRREYRWALDAPMIAADAVLPHPDQLDKVPVVRRRAEPARAAEPTGEA